MISLAGAVIAATLAYKPPPLSRRRPCRISCLDLSADDRGVQEPCDGRRVPRLLAPMEAV